MEIAGLTLDEKCQLLGGASSWRTYGIDRVGIPPVKMSDGPNGVRGEAEGASFVQGVVVPVGIALGSTWDPELIGRVGDLLAVEARRKGAHVLLAPTVNLQRTPVGGRVFECFSEDPELTARLTVSFVRAVQAHAVAVTVKHFVANDTEVERMDVDARVDEATLRELYLRPFEAAVVEAGAWGVMSAYNQVNGEFCAHSRRLLRELLRDEWGFDGFVVSDWGGAHDTVAAIEAGLTVAMPGPGTIYGPPLADAVRRGAVDEADVDAAVADLARLIERTRAAERSADVPQEVVDDPAERALCREAAAESLVLLHNPADVLPLGPTERVAVVGPNAATTRIMGGGSSSLTPLPYRSILAALTDRLGERVTGHAAGVSVDRYLPPLGADVLRTPEGEPGLLMEFRAGTAPDAEVVARDVVASTSHFSFGSAPEAVGDGQFRVTLSGEFVPEQSGAYEVGSLFTGKAQVMLGGKVVAEDPDRRLPRGDWCFGHGTEEQKAVVELTAGVPVPLSISTTGVRRFSAVAFGARPVEGRPRLEEAEQVAADADVTVVVVGTNDDWETEGVDRSTIALPGEQDELVRRVAAVSPRTVVVVNAGAPVAMPWADEVDAVLVASFAGQETGPAVAEVLAGDRDPGGRLPVTYPQRLEDAPAWPHYQPVDGRQTYGEGRLMGYRGHVAAEVAPLWPFGHGLSYGRSVWAGARLSASELRVRGAGPDDGSVRVAVDVSATGDRPVTDVVQVYVARPAAGTVPGTASRTLVGFVKVRLEPGESTTVELAVTAQHLRRWDGEAGWVVDPGEREVLVAASAVDVRERLVLEVIA